MQEIYTTSLRKILENKTKLEKEINVKIANRGCNIFIEGKGEDEYLALKVLEAVNLGFPINTTLLLKDENVILHIINIRDLTKRKNLQEIKARLIGTKRKALCNLEKLTNCAIVVHNNQIGIIGHSDCIDDAIIALESLVHGSRHGNVYARLERERKKRRLAQKEEMINRIK